MEKSWKITLSDGTTIENLRLNGNNFVSETEIKKEMFDGKLLKVTIEGIEDGKKVVNEYKNNDINIYHFDVYRLEGSDEFYAIGGEEYFSSGICIIEWGELIQDALPPDYIKISFSKDSSNPNVRFLDIQSFCSKYDNIFTNLV